MITGTPTVQRGSFPTFTLILRNDSPKAVHLIDVRQRSRWQTFHAALKFLHGGKKIDLTAPISDPSGIDPHGNDHFWLQPEAEERVEHPMR